MIWSGHWFFFSPAMRPRGMEMTKDSTSEVPMSRMVLGSTSRIRSATGWPLLVRELPRLPWSTLFSQPRYWSTMVPSRPRLARRVSISSWVMSGRMYMFSGSPGAKWMMRKEKMDTNSSTGIS